MGLKILASVFSCAPDRGSEPGVGWNVVEQLAKTNDVWVLTQFKHRARIEAELSHHPLPALHFVYFELPVLSRCVRGDGLFKDLYYYLWHLAIYFVARHHHRKIHFDLCHHVTWGRYWMPNLVSLLPVPFMWGPIGGGESVPKAFWKGLGWKGRSQERLRTFMCWLGEHDPFLWLTAKKTDLGLCITRRTTERLKWLGVKKVKHFPYQVGISQKEFTYLSSLKYPDDIVIRFISIGRLIPWKGVHLSLHAFALARLRGAEFFVVGDGEDRKRLEDLAKQLRISESVKFFGGLSRIEAWQQIARCHVLVHASLRGSTTMACLEAMAAGRPVISLNLGRGNNAIPTQDTGFMADAFSPTLAVTGIAAAMVRLANDPPLRERMGQAAQSLIASTYLWNYSVKCFYACYRTCIHETGKCPEERLSDVLL